MKTKLVHFSPYCKLCVDAWMEFDCSRIGPLCFHLSLFKWLYLWMQVSEWDSVKLTVFRTNYSWRLYSVLLVQFRSSILKKYFMNVSIFCYSPCTIDFILSSPLTWLTLQQTICDLWVLSHKNHYTTCVFPNIFMPLHGMWAILDVNLVEHEKQELGNQV